MRERRRLGPGPLSLVVVAVCAIVVGVGATAFVSAGAADSARARLSGPGAVTVRIVIDRSRFQPDVVRVRPHTDVRFVVVNRDPIGHEFIVGGPDVHARHANGTEASHPPVPGEVSVGADARAATTFSFHEPGRVEFACHLPGHYQYGMKGVVVVREE